MFEHDYKNYPELTNTELQEMGLTSPHPQIVDDFSATVVKVHDGDTVTLRAEFRDFDFPLRLLDIDAPELSEGGEESRDWLKGQIEGEDVEIQINPMQRVGKYGRLLGHILYGGIDIGQQEIYLGLAYPFGTIAESQVPPLSKVFDPKKWF